MPARELRNRRGREAGQRLKKSCLNEIIRGNRARSNKNNEKKVPLNKGAIHLVEREAGRGLFPGSRGPFSKYLRFT